MRDTEKIQQFTQHGLIRQTLMTTASTVVMKAPTAKGFHDKKNILP